MLLKHGLCGLVCQKLQPKYKADKDCFHRWLGKNVDTSIDAIYNAYAFDVVAQLYVDLRKLGNKLEGAATYESHKQ